MTEGALPQARRYYSVPETAAILGVSSSSLYRAINAGEFPAVRIRGRFIVPAKALDLVTEVALGSATFDAADWAPRGVAS